MKNRTAYRREGGLRWMIATILSGLLLAACSGVVTTESLPMVPAASATAILAAPAAETPTLQPPEPEPAATAAGPAGATPDLRASAPPLPTQGMPLQPSPVASELSPAGTPPVPAGASMSLPPTPTCASLALTPSDTEGPYFLPNTPERTSFVEPGMTGTPLTVTGYVVTPDCRPVANAQIEFWQAGPDGEYDLQGYRFRGHLFTDANGYYRLETLLPAVYEGRPRHIHVKVLPPGGSELTTQLYFPGDSPVAAQTVAYDETAAGALAVFHFVVP